MAPKKAAKGGGEEKDKDTLEIENKMLLKRLEVLQYRLSKAPKVVPCGLTFE